MTEGRDHLDPQVHPLRHLTRHRAGARERWYKRSVAAFGRFEPDDPGEVGPVQICVSQDRTRQDCTRHIGTAEARPCQVCVGEFARALHDRQDVHDGVTEVGTGQIGAAQIGACKNSAAQIGAREVGAVELHTIQVSSSEIRVGQIGVGDRGSVEAGASKIRPREICEGKVGVLEVLTCQLLPCEVRSTHLGIAEITRR